MSLYVAHYKKLPKTDCPRIERVFWKPLKDVIRDVNLKPDEYTQTFVMWVKNGILC